KQRPKNSGSRSAGAGLPKAVRLPAILSEIAGGFGLNPFSGLHETGANRQIGRFARPVSKFEPCWPFVSALEGMTIPTAWRKGTGSSSVARVIPQGSPARQKATDGRP